MKIRMHSTLVKRSFDLQIIRWGLLLIVIAHPLPAALASHANSSASAQGAITASAVIAPAQVAQLGFLISGMAKDVPVKEGELVKAGQTLLVLDTPDLEFAVVEAQAALHSAQAYAELQKYRRVENRRNGKIFFDVIPVEIRQRAEARVQQAQVMLELAQINLAEGTISAPFTGTVASLGVIPGEFIPSDQAVLTLATLDTAKVKIGAPVEIFVEALNETLRGEVARISPRAEDVGGDVVFKVTIAFDKQPENLLWGMTAEVTIKE
jgi:membrane fusion protein, multidrug efflux system